MDTLGHLDAGHHFQIAAYLFNGFGRGILRYLVTFLAHSGIGIVDSGKCLIYLLLFENEILCITQRNVFILHILRR